LIIETESPITTKGATQRVPDVIVEVKSPDDTNDELREKAKFYVANGARLVWLAFPREKIVEVCRPNVPSEMLTVNDSLDGFDVLSGFALPIVELFIQKRSG
jgi:Uma2 family endonuclease